MRVTSSNSRAASSNPRVRRLKARVARLDLLNLEDNLFH